MKAENMETSTILIVDDNPSNLDVLSEALAGSGWEILVAIDGETAIEQAEYSQPDLILLDVMMPGIDGFETCHRLKASPLTNEISVIFMTALSDIGDKLKGFNLGAVDYITKPFDQKEVLARVNFHLKLHFLTKTLAQQNLLLKREIEDRLAAEAALHQLAQELEKRVEERTAELSQALENLKKAQVQIVQSEKMACLGQLVAGVAHEINNPVSFISNNIPIAKEYIADLIGMTRLCQHNVTSTSEFEDKSQEIELNFIVEDLPKIIDSMELGTERLYNLSMSLRNFSRLDTSALTPVNIHDGLDSTLLILGHRLKSKGSFPGIAVIKEYGKLPLVECYPGQINQVFMNVLANAIDALEESTISCPLCGEKKQSNDTPQIRICTEMLQDDRVVIRIADNGVGITQEVMQHLFTPMFTTKSVGKGTGLGLSISREIVEGKHGGKLTCISSPERGVEFVIELPIQH
ncbi:hybrid sensor histidine kinase/response regulator [Microcoleus asticus]|uniref:histidine kinase n=1 Tax=Microcoleus asticus IPMA8 TaxID=2563858 RepID=A0ABX2D741_9CYAN|nr:response regulator [Microcoleus asticus]NQE37710.1 Response regulator PleD [Microcoleus asticus IPMA8]